MRYAVITGTGRSGTNWLLDTLDASPHTHCRNEPHGIAGTPLSTFPRVWNSDKAGSWDLYREEWDRIAIDVARRIGERDHNFRYPKSYLYPWSNHLGLSRAVTGPRARDVLALVDRRLRGGEWELPRWMGSRRQLDKSLGVLKVLIDAPLVDWLLQERPAVPIIHIVRHPGGRLHSWLTRLVAPMDDAQRGRLLADRSARIQRIRAFDHRWHELIPDPSTLELATMEVWLWRYVNETKMQVGQAHEQYRLLRFDDLAADPVGQAEVMYRHLGLPWNSQIERRVHEDSNRSVFGAVQDPRSVAAAWRSDLDQSYVRAIDQIVADSPLKDLLS